MKIFEYKKSVQVANYFAKHEGNVINKMKILKLLWLADRLHLRIYGRPIVHDQYFALKNGPVATETRDILEATDYARDEHLEYSNKFLKSVSAFDIASIADVDTQVFSKTDLKVLDIIYNEFGGLNQFELVDLSHKYPEWKKFEDYVKNGGRKKMHYIDFFSNPELADACFNQTPELTDLSKEVFLSC
jgi:uncharacterized phage-associated protein